MSRFKLFVGGLIGLILIVNVKLLLAQQAFIKEENITFRTYPFNDPSPVARMHRVYPYYRFDGYSVKARNQEWKIVTLENAYIRVMIAPEIGGKILGAFDKSTGRAFIYFNRVVKFRNIALRGPWTSGGIEFNFGTIGHTPTTATPVDYITRKNEDGSVSCIVGAYDLSARTQWRVEIRLPQDKAYFETRSFWFNPTELNTSLYHWMNAAADATDDLCYYFPGTYYIGHGGRAHPWPINEQGRDISCYKNNNFGGSKSYHVMGEYTNYFAGYYHDKKFGFCHWSLYGDKPGKKIWIWALSRQGAIWKDLLTDPELGNEQYTEIQSGLLFNQAGGGSYRTPFKHLFFTPQSAERFDEAWFPVKDIGGVVKANLYGALNVAQHNQRLKIGFCAIQKIDDALVVKIDDKEIYRKQVHLQPMESFIDSLDVAGDGEWTIVLGENLISYHRTESDEKKLSRPMTVNEDFNWNSVFGIYTQAVDLAKQRKYQQALEKYLACLEQESAFSPALVGAAEIYYRRMEYRQALKFALKALANNTYDPDANFLYGVISKKLKRFYDAKDGFGIAARSMKHRSAAYSQLAEICFREKDFGLAEQYANRALQFNRLNLNALKILALTYRMQHKSAAVRDVWEEILEIDPLNHFVRFEKYVVTPNADHLASFNDLIRNELPQQTYLELAMNYINLNLTDEAIEMLKNCPPHPVASYWSAYLYEMKKMPRQSEMYLRKALDASPRLIYPFRPETADVLHWALAKTNHWKTTYYLGLIYWSKDRVELAKQFFRDCGDQPDYAPFYLTRASLFQSEDEQQVLEDYKKALALDENQWRVYHLLTDYYTKLHLYDQALDIIEKGVKKNPDNFILSNDYANTLLYNKRFKESLAILENIIILPHEGARYGHKTYRQVCVLYALEKMKQGEFQQALELISKARKWDENLGAGKPYDVDTRLEDFMEALCWEKLQEHKKVIRLYDEIIAYTLNHLDRQNSNFYIYILVLRKLGKEKQAQKVVDEWAEKFPHSIAVQWCAAQFKGDYKKAHDLLKKEIPVSEGTPWRPVAGDDVFKLVSEVVKFVEKY